MHPYQLRSKIQEIHSLLCAWGWGGGGFKFKASALCVRPGLDTSQVPVPTPPSQTPISPLLMQVYFWRPHTGCTRNFGSFLKDIHHSTYNFLCAISYEHQNPSPLFVILSGYPEVSWFSSHFWTLLPYVLENLFASNTYQAIQGWG